MLLRVRDIPPALVDIHLAGEMFSRPEIVRSRKRRAFEFGKPVGMGHHSMIELILRRYWQGTSVLNMARRL